MMDEFTKRIINNIYAICKYNSIQIGEVERNAGVATGYLSRLKHSDNSLTFKVAANMAKYIDYSLIDLMTNNYGVELYNNTIRNQIEELKAKQEELEKLLLKE